MNIDADNQNKILTKFTKQSVNRIKLNKQVYSWKDGQHQEVY